MRADKHLGACIEHRCEYNRRSRCMYGLKNLNKKACWMNLNGK